MKSLKEIPSNICWLIELLLISFCNFCSTRANQSLKTPQCVMHTMLLYHLKREINVFVSSDTSEATATGATASFVTVDGRSLRHHFRTKSIYGYRSIHCTYRSCQCQKNVPLDLLVNYEIFTHFKKSISIYQFNNSTVILEKHSHHYTPLSISRITRVPHGH